MEGVDHEEVEDAVPDVDDAVIDQLDTMPFSPTRLESVSCLFRFYSHYVLPQPETSHPILAFGSFVHRVIEMYVTACLKRKEGADPVLAELAAQAAWAEKPTVPPDVFADALNVVQRFAEGYEVPVDRVVGNELQLAADAHWSAVPYDSPDTRRRGRIDQLELDGQDARVVDWKTSRALPTATELKRMYAPRMYMLLVRAQNPKLRRVTVQIYYVRYHKTREVVFEPSDTESARLEIEEAEKRVQVLLGRPNAADPAAWPAMPGTQCGICGWVASCPRQAEVATRGYVTTPEQAEKVAGDIVYLEQALEHKRETLREWVKVVGPVTTSNVRFAYRQESRWEFDVAKILKACQTWGIPAYEVLTVHKKRLEAVLRQAPNLKAAIAGAMKDVGKSKFGWKKLTD